MAAELTAGSLFDGIGGFCFAAQLTEKIKPLWAAEVEPNCINITRYRLNDVMHVGSVTELKGYEIQPVDIITFGSPCQDLSIAGQKKGLKGNRSGLFLEAIRIIEEMRLATNGKYPTFIIWENVPGAFSSRDGEDFRTVLKKITKTNIPMPTSGIWSNAGMVRGGAVDAAWRILDAQFWGVPQRRKRIYLIGDLGGHRAGEILFKSESLLGYSKKSKGEKQEVTGRPTDSFRTKGGRGREIIGLDFAHADSVVRSFKNKTPALLQNMGCGGGQTPCVMYEEKRSFYEVYQHNGYRESDKSGTPMADQNSMIRGDTHLVARTDRIAFEENEYGKYRKTEINSTLRATGGTCGGGSETLIAESTKTRENIHSKPKGIKDILKKAVQKVIYTIRRLTPAECERLQGYPDNWTKYGADGSVIADTARYRAIGNSICVYCAERVYIGILDAIAEVTDEREEESMLQDSIELEKG